MLFDTFYLFMEMGKKKKKLQLKCSVMLCWPRRIMQDVLTEFLLSRKCSSGRMSERH